LLRLNDAESKAANWLLIAGIFLLMLTLGPRLAASTEKASEENPEGASGASADEALLLEVQVNGQSIGKIGEFTLRHGKLMARPDELRDLGFRVPDSRGVGPSGLIALSDLPGLIWSVDQKNQELHVTASDNLLLPTMLHFYGRESPVSRRVIESGTGMTLNYDMAGTAAGGKTGVTGALDLRAFSPWGVASTGWLAYAGAGSSGPRANKAIRLDSTYQFADVNTMRRYSLGDFITGGLAWTRPIHLEGAQVRSDFSMRPDLVTFPLPSVAGSAAVPSTVTVLTDGNLVVSSQVDAGPFEIPQLPVISGAGTISMTVTNALGQQLTVTQPFYASSALLAPGLQTFAVQSGLVRRNWGSASYDYGKFAGTAIYRRGLTPKLTFEGSAEGTPGTFMAGAGGVAQIGNLGVVNFAAAASAGSERPGTQFSLGAQRIGRVFSLGASATAADHSYRDVAAMNGTGVPRKQISAFTSLLLRRFGSAGIAYGGIDQDAAASPILLGGVSGEHSHVVSANYSLQFRYMTMYASEFKSFAGTGGSSGLQIGLTIPFGRRSSVSVGATSDGNGQLQAQQSVSQIGEWGYQAYVSAGDSEREFGEVQYKSPVGLFTAGVDRSSDQTTLRMESQGALSFVDRSLFPSNTIYDSFAIVDTNGLPHVHVLQENRDVGSSDSSGRLLVPDMRSFDLNHITIEPTDIPPDSTINDATREVRPQDRSGVVLRFPVKISHGALLRLVDDGGVPLPVGSTAKLRSSGSTVPVGYDGDAYVLDLDPHNEVEVEQPDGRRCSVTFYYRPMSGEIPTIGPLRCQEQRP
jgi:outer membrane usher protein